MPRDEAVLSGGMSAARSRTQHGTIRMLQVPGWTVTWGGAPRVHGFCTLARMHGIWPAEAGPAAQPGVTCREAELAHTYGEHAG